VRYIIIGLLVFSVGGWLLALRHLPSSSAWTAEVFLGHALLDVLLTVVLGFWYWNLAKLFLFYERGLIFAAETIHCIKTLGLLCAINWLLLLVLNIVNRWIPVPPPPPLPPDVKVTVVKSGFSMGFFSFSIGGINFGFLLAGIVIILIAWIMDEGRKIQEEQELTV
jgi:hypothetical protein